MSVIEKMVEAYKDEGRLWRTQLGADGVDIVRLNAGGPFVVMADSKSDNDFAKLKDEACMCAALRALTKIELSGEIREVAGASLNYTPITHCRNEAINAFRAIVLAIAENE